VNGAARLLRSPRAAWAVEEFLPGDVLLYSANDVFSLVIKFKTWSEICHCEVYLGLGRSGASRPGDGVGTFDLRLDGLWGVLRPDPPLTDEQFGALVVAHRDLVGTPYDYLGLLRVFYGSGRGEGDSGRMWCSEYAVDVTSLKRGGPGMFASTWRSDWTAPGMLPASPRYRLIRKEGTV